MLSAFQEVQENGFEGSQQHTDFDCRIANQKTTVKWKKNPTNKSRNRYRFKIDTAGKQSRNWQD